MSYDNFIANHRPEEGKNGKCRHGVETSMCAYCNGSYEENQKKIAHDKREKDEWNEWKQKYRDLKENHYKHGDVWDNEEVELLYEKMNGISSMRSKKFKKTVYEIAVTLQRTRKSIVWHYKQLFVLDGVDAKSLHAGKTLVEFKKTLLEVK